MQCGFRLSFRLPFRLPFLSSLRGFHCGGLAASIAAASYALRPVLCHRGKGGLLCLAMHCAKRNYPLCVICFSHSMRHAMRQVIGEPPTPPKSLTRPMRIGTVPPPNSQKNYLTYTFWIPPHPFKHPYPLCRYPYPKRKKAPEFPQRLSCLRSRA